ncbi:MAG: ribonuclease P protein component [Acidimicrobiales bacterium]|jgi:ribonuclease P protein component
MLTKKQRLTKKEFDRSFSVGKRHHSTSLQLIHHADDSFHGACVVGKKVFKRAVDRNRLRRRMYGVLYRYHKEYSLKGTFILIAKPSLKEVEKALFTKEVESLLEQAI